MWTMLLWTSAQYDSIHLLYEGFESYFINLHGTFGNLAKGWIGIVGENFFCVTNGAKLHCVVDISS
jgi:hypothetical protein